jgi:hypothetical protein
VRAKPFSYGYHSSVLLWIPFDIPLRNHRNGMTRGTTSGTAVWSAKPGLPTGVHRAFSYGFRERSLASTERSLMDTIRHTIAKSSQWYDPGDHLRYRSLVRQTGTSHWRPQSVLIWIPGTFTGVHRAFSYGYHSKCIGNHRDDSGIVTHIPRATMLGAPSSCQSDL